MALVKNSQFLRYIVTFQKFHENRHFGSVFHQSTTARNFHILDYNLCYATLNNPANDHNAK